LGGQQPTDNRTAPDSSGLMWAGGGGAKRSEAVRVGVVPWGRQLAGVQQRRRSFSRMKRRLNINHQTAQPGHGSRESAGNPGTGRPRNGEGVGEEGVGEEGVGEEGVGEEGVGEGGEGAKKKQQGGLLRRGTRGSDRRMAGCSISRRISRGLLSKHRLLRRCWPVSRLLSPRRPLLRWWAGWMACAGSLAGLAGWPGALGSQMMAPMGGSGTTTSIGTVVGTWLGHVADPREAQGSAATATVPPANQCARGVAFMSRLASVSFHARRACVAILDQSLARATHVI
jgi:hypothetical protein